MNNNYIFFFINKNDMPLSNREVRAALALEELAGFGKESNRFSSFSSGSFNRATRSHSLRSRIARFAGRDGKR